MNPEPKNLFYTLLLAVSLAFVVTALAYALLPWDEQPAWLQAHGWKLLLIEVAAVIVLGLLSIGLDRIRDRRIRNEELGIRDWETRTDDSTPNP